METFDPTDIENKIILAKKQLKDLSSNFQSNFSNIENYIQKEVLEIENLIQENKRIIPEIDFVEIKNNNVKSDMISFVKKKGCVVIQNVFKKELVNKWNDELSNYIEANNYYDDQKEKAGLDQYFSELKSGKPQIFGLYWSKPQIQIRQSENMAAVKIWLNNLWKNKFNEETIFLPDKELVYADRVRRREAGDSSLGLSPHCDAGSVERWIDKAYQKIYEPIFCDNFENYDPFNAKYRNQTEEIPSRRTLEGKHGGRPAHQDQRRSLR